MEELAWKQRIKGGGKEVAFHLGENKAFQKRILR